MKTAREIRPRLDKKLAALRHICAKEPLPPPTEGRRIGIRIPENATYESFPRYEKE